MAIVSQKAPELDIKEFIQKTSSSISEVTLNPLYDKEGNKTNNYGADIKIKKRPRVGQHNQIEPDASSVQSIQWLCAYYKKYESARPNGIIPEYCSRY